MSHTHYQAPKTMSPHKLRNSECRHENRGNTITDNYCACSRQNRSMYPTSKLMNTTSNATMSRMTNLHWTTSSPMLTTVPSFYRIQCIIPFLLVSSVMQNFLCTKMQCPECHLWPINTEAITCRIKRMFVVSDVLVVGID